MPLRHRPHVAPGASCGDEAPGFRDRTRRMHPALLRAHARPRSLPPFVNLLPLGVVVREPAALSSNGDLGTSFGAASSGR